MDESLYLGLQDGHQGQANSLVYLLLKQTLELVLTHRRSSGILDFGGYGYFPPYW